MFIYVNNLKDIINTLYMNIKHNIYLISDSTGETIGRIFLALKAQFKNFEYNNHQFSFTRTENQIQKILELAKEQKEPIILYTIVDDNLAKYLEEKAKKLSIPCFGVLGDLILNFSKLLKQKASHIPSGLHTLEEHYKRIEAIQFTMNHDDGNLIDDIKQSDIIEELRIEGDTKSLVDKFKERIEEWNIALQETHPELVKA